MFELRPIAKESIPRALLKAERYRLLNEPREAESICRDILAVDPQNQPALVCLVLALTDLFHGFEHRAEEVRPLIARLADPFEREYYAGVVEERWAKALLAGGYPHDVVHTSVRVALKHFDAAETLAPSGNDDAALRWNACVRMIRHHNLAPAQREDIPDSELFGDDVPAR